MQGLTMGVNYGFNLGSHYLMRISALGGRRGLRTRLGSRLHLSLVRSHRKSVWAPVGFGVGEVFLDWLPVQVILQYIYMCLFYCLFIYLSIYIYKYYIYAYHTEAIRNAISCCQPFGRLDSNVSARSRRQDCVWMGKPSGEVGDLSAMFAGVDVHIISYYDHIMIWYDMIRYDIVQYVPHLCSTINL